MMNMLVRVLMSIIVTAMLLNHVNGGFVPEQDETNLNSRKFFGLLPRFHIVVNGTHFCCHTGSCEQRRVTREAANTTLVRVTNAEVACLNHFKNAFIYAESAFNLNYKPLSYAREESSRPDDQRHYVVDMLYRSEGEFPAAGTAPFTEVAAAFQARFKLKDYRFMFVTIRQRSEDNSPSTILEAFSVVSMSFLRSDGSINC